MSTRRMMMASAQHVVDGVIQDSWEEIIENSSKGLAKKYYSIGDVKQVDLKDYGMFEAEIIGFDCEIKDTGNAMPISWWFKTVYSPTINMHLLFQSADFGFQQALALGSNAFWRHVDYDYISMHMDKKYRDFGPLWIKSNSLTGDPNGYTVNYSSSTGYVNESGIRTSKNTAYVPAYMFGTGPEEWTEENLCISDDIQDSWEEIIEKSHNGTIATDYSIGDAKTLVIEGASIKMQYAGYGLDTRADGSVDPVSTWITKDIVAMVWDDRELWDESMIRTFCQDRVFNSLPTIIRDNIIEVKKEFVTKSNQQVIQTDSSCATTDKVWVPSLREVLYSPLLYSELKNSGKFSMAKAGVGQRWFTRTNCSSKNTSPGTYIIKEDGGTLSSGSACSSGLVFGFCL